MRSHRGLDAEGAEGRRLPFLAVNEHLSDDAPEDSAEQSPGHRAGPKKESGFPVIEFAAIRRAGERDRSQPRPAGRSRPPPTRKTCDPC